MRRPFIQMGSVHPGGSHELITTSTTSVVKKGTIKRKGRLLFTKPIATKPISGKLIDEDSLGSIDELIDQGSESMDCGVNKMFIIPQRLIYDVGYRSTKGWSNNPFKPIVKTEGSEPKFTTKGAFQDSELIFYIAADSAVVTAVEERAYKRWEIKTHQLINVVYCHGSVLEIKTTEISGDQVDWWSKQGAMLLPEEVFHYSSGDTAKEMPGTMFINIIYNAFKWVSSRLSTFGEAQKKVDIVTTGGEPQFKSEEEYDQYLITITNGELTIPSAIGVTTDSEGTTKQEDGSSKDYGSDIEGEAPIVPDSIWDGFSSVSIKVIDGIAFPFYGPASPSYKPIPVKILVARHKITFEVYYALTKGSLDRKMKTRVAYYKTLLDQKFKWDRYWIQSEEDFDVQNYINREQLLVIPGKDQQGVNGVWFSKNFPHDVLFYDSALKDAYNQYRHSIP